MEKLSKILIVEDEESHIELIKRSFSNYQNYFLTCAGSLVEAKKLLSLESFDVILSDWRLPDGEGIELMSGSKDKISCPVVLMTSFGNQELAVEAMKLGVIEYIVKSNESINKLPFTINRVIREWDNIIARERAEKALRQSEARYRSYVETTKDVIFQANLNGNLMFLNTSGCKLYNISKEEVASRNIGMFFKGNCPSEFMEAIQQVTRKNTQRELLMLFAPKGNYMEMTVNLVPYTNSNGVIDSVIGVCHDITEIKRTEKALKMSESKFKEQSELFSNILQHIPDFIYWKDNNSYFRGCNKNFANYVGFNSVDDVIGKTDFDFNWLKETAEKNHADDAAVSEKGFMLLDMEEERITTDGKRTVISKSIIPLKDEEGNKAGVLCLFSDITKRKSSEEELRKLSRATEQSPAFITIADINGNIEYVNPSFEKITGYLLSEIRGKKPFILQQHVTDSKLDDEVWSTLQSGNEWREELQNNKKNGEIYWESASISSIKNEKGEITHFLAVEEDITEKKELELELKRALDRAEESSRVKSSLLSNMSHELRTPLNGILGLSQILIEELSENSLATFARKIYLAGKRLMVTLNSILDLSEIESNTTLIKFVEYNITENLNYILTQYIYAANEKGLQFYIDILDKNIVAFVDERLCNQIVLNLVDNAVKYTYEGEISVALESEIRNGSPYVKISVSDTGIGIEEGNLAFIFEEFRQVSEGYNRSFEGTGLGLSLVKKMLQLLKGEIKVESKIGKGSKFIVYLPGAVKKQVEKETDGGKDINAVTRSDNKKPEILLVEDNSINKEVITCYINNFCNVDAVSDGLSSIEKAQNKQYDVVLMDINLGNGMDGIAATKEIKKIKGYENTAFVALTGYALSGDKQRLLDEGLTHYLPKPFEKEELQKLLKGILNKEKDKI